MGPGRELWGRGKVGAGIGTPWGWRANKAWRTERMNEPSRDGAPRHWGGKPRAGTTGQQLAGLQLPQVGAAPALVHNGDTGCPVPGGGDSAASASEQWRLAKLVSAPRVKFERQNGNTQNGGWEDEGILLSCSCSNFVQGFGWFSPRSHGVAVIPRVGGVSVTL